MKFGCDGMTTDGVPIPGSHCSTVKRLYELKKKLYEEVKVNLLWFCKYNKHSGVKCCWLVVVVECQEFKNRAREEDRTTKETGVEKRRLHENRKIIERGWQVGVENDSFCWGYWVHITGNH